MDDKTEVLEAVVKEAVDLVPKQSNPPLCFFFFFETLSENYFICIEFFFLVHLLSGVGISGGFVWNFHFVWFFLLLGLR